MTQTRRTLLVSMAAASAALGPWSASAQGDYPSRPVRVIVPYAAGGGTDFFARLVFAEIGRLLGQQFVVENRPGAGTNIGAEAVARAEPDGYTLLLGDTATFSTNRTLYARLPFDPYKDFSPISLTGRFALVLLVNANKVKAASVQELIAAAKANPGGINYATPGVGSPFHLATELLSQAAGIKLTHVPYRGAAPALTDLIAGRIQLLFDTLGLVQSHLGTGSIRLLAVATPSRFAALPDLPTAAEAGVPGAEVNSWQALVAPARTDPAIVAKLTAALRQALASPELSRFYAERGFLATYNPPEAVRANMAAETASWTEVIRQASIRLD